MDDYNATVLSLVNFNRQSSIQVPIPTRDEWLDLKRRATPFRSIVELDAYDEAAHGAHVLG
jgi:hypothetical protein